MTYFVVATVKDTQPVIDWCEEHIEESKQPGISVVMKNNRSFIVRARFKDKETATIFRLFWDGNAH